jgi:PAS domain S-box-containing protein
MLYRGSSSALEFYELDATYRALFENNGMAMAVVDETMTIALINRAFEELSGYSKSQLENGMRWMQLVHEDDRADMSGHHIMCAWTPVSSNRHCMFRMARKDGKIRDIYLSMTNIPGTRKGIFSMADIMEAMSSPCQQQLALSI